MSRVFNKLNGVLLAGFFGGILVMGIGCGVAFAEYSDFELVDDKLVSGSRLDIKEIEYEMKDDESVLVPVAQEITFDESIPAGTLLVEVEYDAQIAEVEWGTYEEADDARYCSTVFEIYYYRTMGDFEVFMMNKDVILQGLKEGKFVGLEIDPWFTAVVKANPADEGRVFNDYDAAYQAFN